VCRSVCSVNQKPFNQIFVTKLACTTPLSLLWLCQEEDGKDLHNLDVFCFDSHDLICAHLRCATVIVKGGCLEASLKITSSLDNLIWHIKNFLVHRGTKIRFLARPRLERFCSSPCS
jgi:hypothetical protein